MERVFRRWKRPLSGILSLVIIIVSLLPHVSAFDIKANMHHPGEQIAAYSENWHHYCIDAHGVAANGVLQAGDMYTYVLPSTQLSNAEMASLFWATLSMLAGAGNNQNINTVVDRINQQAPGKGLTPINRLVTEEDLKTIIHKASTLAKYPWITDAVNNAKEYMEMGGIISGSGSAGTGSKTIPSVLHGHTNLSAALLVDNHTYTIEFDLTGADADFIQKVPLLFSPDGSAGSFVPEPFGGWIYQKTDTSIIFTNPNPELSTLYIQFETAGTEYAVNGGFSSVEEAYEYGLQLWVCTECCNNHINHSKTVPLENHQRMVYLELDAEYERYYAAINGGSLANTTSGSITFQIYRHEEEMTSTYKLKLQKADYETGQPLEGAIFKGYERFDDSSMINRSKDGHEQLYEGGEPYKSYHKDEPVVWDDFRFIGSLVTNQDGEAQKTINHSYHYDKTFCDGHPAPVFAAVPAEETDDESGEIINSGEIAAAQAENQRLAKLWLDCADDCESHASGEFDGVHFHWMMSEVYENEIKSILSTGGGEGETPNGGRTTSANEEDAYRESGCEADCKATYDRFIALKYSYAFVEDTAREGYIRHGQHSGDLPIEVITSDASENGANSSFAGIYGHEIQINTNHIVRSAKEVKAERIRISSYQIPETATADDDTHLAVQKPVNYLQPILKFLEPLISVRLFVDDNEKLPEWEIDEDQDVYNDIAEQKYPTATDANAQMATASNASVYSNIAFTATSSDATTSISANSVDDRERSGGGLFNPAYQIALNMGSTGKRVSPGSAENDSHCYKIYNHRTEGEIHANKRDLELEEGEHGYYDSLGDVQGDATVEGAMYLLYAGEDIIHPDGKTGVVYKNGNLSAIAATDKEGNFSYLLYTEAPGYVYDYERGQVVKSSDGWAEQAPNNLYVSDQTIDDYPADGQYERVYDNNKANNGNSWIGRPLLSGRYYIKEGARSEGYELSVGNKGNSLTNLGQDLNAGVSLHTGNGNAAITKNLYPEAQISKNPTGEYGDPDYNELFFRAESMGTGADGFDLVLNNLPEGARVYRLDEGTETKQIAIGTGIYDKIMLGFYVSAEHDYQYPKYNSDGSLMTREVPAVYYANQFLAAQPKELDPATTQIAMERAEEAMSEAEVAAKLAEDFEPSDINFFKCKVEKALRLNGKNTPKTAGGGYSDIYSGVFDEGIRKGEPDVLGISGVLPGESAARTVYGSPVTTLELDKLDDLGDAITLGDAILSVLDFYNSNSFYSYGGIHSIEEQSDKYYIMVYAGLSGNPADFFVLGTNEINDSTIYHRLSYLPDDVSESPRYVYVAYSNHPAREGFGTYDNYRTELIGGRWFISARLLSDAVVTGDGTIITKTIRENVYYQTGETPTDNQGDLIEAFEMVEQTITTMQEIQTGIWTEIPVAEGNKQPTVHISSTYTDAYGNDHNDSQRLSYFFRIVVPERELTLTQDDIDQMADPTGWNKGDKIGGAAYFTMVKHASIKAYINYAELSESEEGSYVKPVTLSYPGQTYVWQDGEGKPGTNTRLNPIGVQQRVIKQQVKVTKTIDKASYDNTNSYSEVHEDWFTKLFGGFLGKGSEAGTMANFRFKTYLKSNLERLYRDQNGQIVWQDRKGNNIDILEAKKKFPALVSNIYTKAPHKTDPLFQNSNDAVIHNIQLYDYTDGLINEVQNSGYTAVLETIRQPVDDGDTIRMVSIYNYEKFFAAIAVANQDKWDDGKPTYTSYRPIGNQVNRTDKTLENAKVSDMVRQFAIDWYLEDEIALLVRVVPDNDAEKEAADGNVAYPDEVYDEALYQAIQKSNNYLKPFFTYDLDEIYAIEWDSEADGGADGDRTTLSADKEEDSHYFNTSVYLPYGIYVQVEQQPRYSHLDDFANRHYLISKPQEVVVPTVYASYQGSQQVPEELNSYYNYDVMMTPEELAAKYLIRFGEECHVVKGKNHSGYFEVYKYGLSLRHLNNGVPETLAAGDFFALTQSEFRPEKNYYNELDDQTTKDVPYYLTEGLSGREEVSKIYHYSSVAEALGVAADIPYPGAPVTADNPYGTVYRDNVSAMQGILTAYDGKYAPMLVPYTVTAPARENSEKQEVDAGADGLGSFVGYAYHKVKNRFATYKLRIEKLDSETHENILHDEALFNIYAARRNDEPGGDGSILFYEKDTLVIGTKDFLKGMGAANIVPMSRRAIWTDRLTGKEYGPGNLYTGIVPAGTPICEESEPIILGDAFGNQTAAFKTYSTSADGLMKDENNGSLLVYQNQNVGYLETPQPLGAGAYVLVEVKAPVGYARSTPIALEVYSDQVSYYQRNDPDERVIAAIFTYQADYPTANRNKPQDITAAARIHVENEPITLIVEKVKESSKTTAETTADKTVTYKISGRVDGTLTEIGNDPAALVYAYDENGTYLGYGWKKGTLEQLTARKAAGELVEVAYEGNQFAGYGYITRSLGTAGDKNPYAAGAVLTLFDALALTPAEDTQDRAYQGLVVERNRSNDVVRMYVREGYAGEKVKFIREADENGEEYQITYEAGVDASGNSIYASGAIWKAETVPRKDTDILFYDLGGLDIFTTKTIAGTNVRYGYDRQHVPIPITVLESDKANFAKTDNEHAIYAFKGGVAYLEFTGGDFNQITYDPADKVLEVGAGTQVYHLDRDGARTALVDPYTGMAYVTETQPDGREEVLVWAVHNRTDVYGNVIARDKITTSRIAAIGEKEESIYILGSWKSESGEESHQESTAEKTSSGLNINESILLADNNGYFEKELNPVYDQYGLPVYYQRSDELYDKGTELYDRNDEFVRYQDSDKLAAYNQAAYRINEQGELHDGQEELEVQNQYPLYHRQGEAYILENTWMTSDRTPNDPFDLVMTDGQADILKRVPDGTYIMEEVKSPTGKNKGMPVGLTIRETAAKQYAKMVDTTTKVEIGKIDGAEQFTVTRRDMETGKTMGIVSEGKGRYSYTSVSGAELALYEAERIDTVDGSYLKKKSDTPVVFDTTNSTISTPEQVYADWISGTRPIYFEGLPAGEYLLEEIQTPSGFVTSIPIEICVANTKEVQSFTMYEDHTKVEVEKYMIQETEKKFLANVGFTLYPARTNTAGEVIFQDGKPQYDAETVIDTWFTEDAADYTNTIELTNYPNTNQTGLSGFITEFEAMYKQSGTRPGTTVQWAVERSAARTSEADPVWIMEDGTRIVIVDGVITYPSGMTQEDMDGFLAAYETNQRQDHTIRWINNRWAAYVTHKQIDSGNGGTRFPVTAELLYQADNGQEIRIVIYQGSADRQGKTFEFEYQFDYKKLPYVNAYACSYLTPEGFRRFDYLPAGEHYVLVETGVPAGFTQAPDLVITVSDIPDVQHYAVINEIHSLRISKVSGTGTKELTGNQLSLYRAAADGSLRQTPEYLVVSWITGGDGRYSESDFINGRIPQGYGQGDLRPHTISGLSDGIYYLTEEQSKDYYTLIEPVRIEYKGEEEIRIIRVSNQVTEGELEIIKTDATGQSFLTGTVFEVSAYVSGSREALFTKVVCTIEGKAKLAQLPVGRLLTDGSIEPYLYRVKEIVPADGYSVSSLNETFSFAPNQDGVSYATGETARYMVWFKNEKTRIYIEKRDFNQLEDNGTDGMFVSGAELVLYELNGRDENGNFLYDESSPILSWLTTAGERHLIEGLTAGRSYLLMEQKAPAGYVIMQPVVLTLSGDGRRIVGISNKLNAVSVNTIQIGDFEMDFDNPDLDSVQSLTLWGRYPTKVEMILQNAAGSEVVRWTATGSGYDLYQSEAVPDGEVCKVTELTHFSDGSHMVTGTMTRRIYYNDIGIFYIKDRSIQQDEVVLSDTDGIEIYRYEPKESFDRSTIENNVTPENPAIIMKNRLGDPGDALDPQQAVYGSVFYVNLSREAADMKVFVRVSGEIQILEDGGGERKDNTITWTIPNVKPLEGGYVNFAGEIQDQSALSASVEAVLQYNGLIKTAAKETPIRQPGQLTIYNELTGSGQELQQAGESRFKLRLFSKAGEELKGSYAYSGSISGSVRSGETITLSGNQFVTIDPGDIYQDVQYQVERIDDGLQVTSRYPSGSIVKESGAAVVFTRHVSDTSERELFIKGESYLLTEMLSFSDGQILEGSKYKFMISDNGGIDGIAVYNRQTKVQLSKIDITTGIELPGAHLVIRDKDDQMIAEWISGDEPYEFAGLIPGEEYTLSEVLAPDGYGYAEELHFVVEEDGSVEQVVMEDKPTYVVFSKQDLSGNRELPGGHYSIREESETGPVVYEYDGDTEGKPQVVTGILKAGHKYWFVEDLSPLGFAYVEAVSFTVSNDGSIDEVVMKDAPTHVVIRKENQEEELLGGAILQIKDMQGSVVAEFETTAGMVYELKETLAAGHTYILHEVKAPDGYLRAEDITFTVSHDGSKDIIVMTDLKIRVGGGKTPQITEPEKTSGIITASYQAKGMTDAVEFINSRGELAKAGDTTNQLFWFLSTVFFLLAMIMLKVKQKLKLRAFCVVLWGLLFFFQVAVFYSFTAYGSAQENNAAVIQRTEFSLNQEIKQPETSLWQGGSEYDLEQWSIKPDLLPERRQQISGAAICRDLEAVETVPESIGVQVTDTLTNETQEFLCQVIKHEMIGERWEADFTVPLVIHNYPADSYQLGTKTVMLGDELAELAALEQELLDLIDLPPTDYRIQTVQWNGDPYLGETGEWCRPAIALGLKKKQTYQLYYSGEAIFEACSGYRMDAVYRIRKEPDLLSEILPEEIRERVVIVETWTEDKKTDEMPVPADPEFSEILKKVIIISIGIGLLIFLLAFGLWLVTWKKKNKKDDFSS